MSKKLERLITAVIIILVLNFILISNYALISSHERSHEAINNIFGCDSKIEINIMSGYTETYNCDLNNADQIAMKLAQSNVEVTYVDMTFYRIVIVALAVLVGMYAKRRILERILKNE